MLFGALGRYHPTPVPIMESVVSRFWNTRTSGLVPYTPGEQPAVEGLIKLNTNEHPLAPSERATEVLSNTSENDLRLYPDPRARQLRNVIASQAQLSSESVFIGNGSDDVLAHIFLALLDTVDELAIPAVTYSFYPVWAKLCGIGLRRIPLKTDFSIDLDTLMACSGPVMLANPNAPTGLAIDQQAVAALLDFDRDRLVIIDEAYFGFGAESAVPLVAHYDNLVVTRTLSKSHALAGLRVGYAVAQPALIEGLMRVKDSFNSYPVDAVAQRVAMAAILDSDWFDSASRQVVEWREKLSTELTNRGFMVLPSRANFLFITHSSLDGEAIYGALRARKVLVRHWAKPPIHDWLRVTVGNQQENSALLGALDDIIEC